MIINSHDLVHSNQGGNGFHGHCAHCGVALVTDLGYCSWDGLKCVDREIVDTKDMPKDILSYAKFHSLIWNKNLKKFIKPFYSDEYTLEEINENIQKSRLIHGGAEEN